MSMPEGWSKVPEVTGYMSGVENLQVHTDGNSVVIVCDALDDEAYGAHSCDEMGCGWSHVLVRLFDGRAALSPAEAAGEEGL